MGEMIRTMIDSFNKQFDEALSQLRDEAQGQNEVDNVEYNQMMQEEMDNLRSENSELR